MSNVNWYVIRAVSGQEKKVKSYLEHEVARQKLEEYVPQILIPSEKIVEMRNGKKRIREKAFFPGYVIISADLSHGEVMHMIMSMPGVIGFLGSNEKDRTLRIPVPLRASEVKRMLGQVDEVQQEEVAPAITFMRGEQVKVMDGPFSGFTGSIEEIFDDKKKLQVMVKIFGRNTPVELSYTQVEKES